MSFIIAFLGIIIYSIAYIISSTNQKIASERIERDVKVNESRLHLWEAKVVDRDLEYKVMHTNLLWDDENHYKDIITNVIRSIPLISEDFGDEYGYYKFFKVYTIWCARILMAYNGKLLYNDAMKGIRSPGVYDSEVKKEWKMNHQLMIWINDQLKSHGINEEMYFVNGCNLQSCVYKPEQIIPLNKVDGTVGGRYCWLSMIHNMPIY
ncbi:MAG: hypothetical protein MJZ03_00460 [archaeon]|nr:hypothetical protein [archaeon]